MRGLRVILLLALFLGVASCSKFRTYNGPQVTQVNVFKSSRTLQLMHHDRVLETFEFELGFAPTGHKMFEGDGRTPEGMYFIDRRNPNSEFHLSIGISYPDAADLARALEMELDPGGDIFIHGTPRMFRGKRDWTAGCIAVSNRDMEKIYAMVQNGTPIMILP
jgi:murein L,D-transpeptidase YafK